MTKNPADLLLDQHLDYLKLPYLKENCQPLAAEGATNHWSHLDYLGRLIQGEVATRQDRVIARRIKAARFPVIKTLEAFRWDWPKQINRLQIQELFRLRFIEEKANVIFLGLVGLGKPHLATALGYAACQHGYSVLFANAIDVINTLSAAQTKGVLKSELKRYLTRVTAPRRDRLSSHRPARSRPALPGHQPTLRTRFYRPYLQQSLQTMGYHLQRR